MGSMGCLGGRGRAGRSLEARLATKEKEKEGALFLSSSCPCAPPPPTPSMLAIGTFGSLGDQPRVY